MEESRFISSTALIEKGYTKHPMIIQPNTQAFLFRYTKDEKEVTYDGVDFKQDGEKIRFMHEVK